LAFGFVSGPVSCEAVVSFGLLGRLKRSAQSLAEAPPTPPAPPKATSGTQVHTPSGLAQR